MGVCQFRQGVETVRALASLAMLTGNLGKPNVGVNPVRGQNNVQGACDMGALFNTLPGYQSFADPEINAKFAKAWGVPSIPTKPGVPLSEVPKAIMEDKIKAFYIMGEDTLQTEPDINAVKKAFEKVELLIVQDIFMTQKQIFYYLRLLVLNMKVCIVPLTAVSNVSIKPLSQLAMSRMTG